MFGNAGTIMFMMLGLLVTVFIIFLLIQSRLTNEARDAVKDAVRVYQQLGWSVEGQDAGNAHLVRDGEHLRIRTDNENLIISQTGEKDYVNKI